MTMKDIELKKLINNYVKENAEMGRRLANLKEESLLNNQALVELNDAANKQIAHLHEVIAGLEAKNNFSLTKSILDFKSKILSQSSNQTVQSALSNKYSFSNQMLNQQADQASQANQSISQAIQDAVNSSNVS